MIDIIVIAHNIRSTHNVGSLFRTCEGFGVKKIILSGYTPYPVIEHDERLPHLATKLTAQIHKTALGAETLVAFEHILVPPISDLKSAGYVIIGLEQDKRSTLLSKVGKIDKIALLIGEEVKGINQSLREQCELLIEIPMQGKKESFNVSVATGIALYGLTVTT